MINNEATPALPPTDGSVAVRVTCLYLRLLGTWASGPESFIPRLRERTLGNQILPCDGQAPYELTAF